MGIFEWAGIGAIMFVLVIFCARIMRRGLTTLDDARQKHLERIAEGTRKLEEEKKDISSEEQLYLLEAAIRDLIRLDSKDRECSIEVRDHLIELHCPEASWQVELLMRERRLRSRHKVLHGQSRWLLRGKNINEEHREIATLMASLTRHFHGEKDIDAIPQHLARRLARNRKCL